MKRFGRCAWKTIGARPGRTAPRAPGAARSATADATAAAFAIAHAFFASLAFAASSVPSQSVLGPAGPQAAAIRHLWVLTVALCLVVLAAIVGALLFALLRAPRATSATTPDLSSLTEPEPGLRRAVAAASIVSAALLFVLLVADVFTDRALAGLGDKETLRIQVTANQWWWNVRYDDPEPARIFQTANEIHVPVGRTVEIELRSNDVIHSFWVPNLHGKKDLIPGRTATLRFQADRPGTYRGQCAEFCGYQHAQMGLLVIAEVPDRYEAWAARQRENAPEPRDAVQARGRDLFVGGPCALCHTIGGTSAQGRHAPDLTHLAGRQTLAAATLPNTVGHLAGWIVDPQSVKPGVDMPSNPLGPDDLHALLAYLVTLQ